MDGAYVMREEYIGRIWDTLRNTTISLPVGILDIFAGYLVANMLPIISISPILLTIYPMILTARGNINGVLSGNISTLLHLGYIRPGLRENTEQFYTLLSGIFTISILAGTYISLLASIPIYILGRLDPIQFLIGLTTTYATILISIYLNIPLTVYIASKSFEAAYDPDMVVYPIMSTLADILVTLVYAATAVIVTSILIKNPILPAISILVLSAPALIYIARHRPKGFGYEVFRESTPVIAILIVVSTFTGGLLTGLLEGFIENPIVLVIYPAFATLMGDVGAILASISTTKLRLGDLEASYRSISELTPEYIGIGLTASAMIFASTGLAYILTGGAPITFLYALGRFYLAYLILIPIIIFLTTTIAITSFRRGYNPDNIAIPIETTLMDLLTAALIYIIIKL